TLLILPLGGLFCEHPATFGWPAIFYLSAIIGVVILIVWLFLSADKPSKHFLVSKPEERYITRKINEEKLGKRTDRGNPPWGKLARCLPLYVAVAALVCHEYPLVIMLQLLPKYFSDVLGLSNVVNGMISSLPSIVLFVSKTFSSILASLLTARKPPLLGMHTPGVQTALVQIAPAYSGIVTGIAFAVVAVFSIINKMISSYIVSSGTSREWGIVFGISAVVAFLPVVFFTRWGSADIQPWASTQGVTPKQEDSQSMAIEGFDKKFSMDLKYCILKRMSGKERTEPQWVTPSSNQVSSQNEQGQAAVAKLAFRELMLSRCFQKKSEITKTILINFEQ
ncbi:hypothetical protein TELCIR_12734, partial [Teladorsagia circumcincta]